MIVVSHGKDIIKSTIDALTASDIDCYLNREFSVALKPNLVVARPASGGATTHPEVLEAIIIFLKEYGIKSIRIIESSWVGDSTKRAYTNCGYTYLTNRYGVPLIDLKDDNNVKLSSDNYSIKVCREALETDFLINVPVLKAHGQARLTCCMKNLKGCIPDSEKRRFHMLGLHKPIAELNRLIKVGYNVIDGICGDLTFEEGGTPVESNKIIVGRSAFLLDSYCAGLIGYSPEEIGYLSYGKQIGLGEFFSSEDELIELNTEEKSSVNMMSSRVSDRYAKMIKEESACSACYSSLLYALHRYNPRAKNLETIHIGQGFRGISEDGIGIGNCTCLFSKNIPGCPPSAVEIYEALQQFSNPG